MVNPPITLYHNAACGTSRNTLALIRNAGVEPTVIEYLKTPPDRATLERLLRQMRITASCCGRKARPTRTSGSPRHTGPTRN